MDVFLYTVTSVLGLIGMGLLATAFLTLRSFASRTNLDHYVIPAIPQTTSPEAAAIEDPEGLHLPGAATIQDAEELHVWASLCRSAGLPAEARGYLQQALLSQGDSDDYHNCALEAERLAEFDLAERLYRRALAASPDNSRTERDLADLLSKASRVQEADTIFERLLKTNPEDERLQAYFGQHLARHRPADLRSFLDRIKSELATRPGLLRPWLALAHPFAQQAGIAPADLTGVLTSTAELTADPGLLAQAASIEFDAGDRNQGAVHYISAIRLGLKDPTALHNLAADLNRIGRPDLAFRIARAVVDLHPGRDPTWKVVINYLVNNDLISIQQFQSLRSAPSGAERLRLLKDVSPMPPGDLSLALREVARTLEPYAATGSALGREAALDTPTFAGVPAGDQGKAPTQVAPEAQQTAERPAVQPIPEAAARELEGLLADLRSYLGEAARRTHEEQQGQLAPAADLTEKTEKTKKILTFPTQAAG
ncbi:MAG: tetratricopeptide repeat protein [Dehalococcoidia bacterium]